MLSLSIDNLSTVWGDLHINERRLTPSLAISTPPILLITHAHLHGSSAYWLSHQSVIASI